MAVSTIDKLQCLSFTICKRAHWSAKAESEAQEEGAKWVGRPAGNSGSWGYSELVVESRRIYLPHLHLAPQYTGWLHWNFWFQHYCGQYTHPIRCLSSMAPKLSNGRPYPVSYITDCSPNYKIGAHVLQWSDETRDLGVIIDKKLNFNSHVSAVAHKAHVRASLILRTFKIRDPIVLTQAFITYVLPLLEHCTSVWSPYTVSNINKWLCCGRGTARRACQ